MPEANPVAVTQSVTKKGQTTMKRSLILAGGGMKVGWQAGVMQVLMDEAGLKFDHIDAASGGVFNLSMLLSGKSATHIAESWGTTSPLRFLAPHKPWRYLLPWKLPSLVTLEGIRKRVLPHWGVDFQKITSCTEVNGHPVVGTFNVTDFGAKRLKVIPHTKMDVDYLMAAVSLPGFFPPVFKDGTIYTDAVFLKDQNLAEAVRRGADEIWVIWTVNDEAKWKGSFYNHYFHIVETTANGSYKLELDEVEKINHRVHSPGLSNEAVSNASPEGKRHITVHEIRPEAPVPIDYLLWIRKKTMRDAVELGRQYARDYLIGKGYLEPAPTTDTGKGLRFTETMSGFFTPGEANHEAGHQQGEASGNDLEFKITITVDDLDRFLLDPQHPAPAQGVVRSSYFGGTCLITRGEFNLFTTDQDDVRHMEYALEFKTAADRRYVLKGIKTVEDGPGLDIWADTTTLMTQVLDADSNNLVGAGILRISVTQFLRQMMTFHAFGTSSALESVEVIGRFGKFFMGNLWDTYGAHYFRR